MRISPFLGPALGAIAGGVIATLVTLWAVLPKTPEKKRAPRTETEAVAEPPELEGRVAALERAVQRLHQQRALLPSLSSAKAAAADAAGSKDTPPVVDDPVFEAAVRDVMQRVEEEKIADRELERSERRRQMAARSPRSFSRARARCGTPTPGRATVKPSVLGWPSSGLRWSKSSVRSSTRRRCRRIKRSMRISASARAPDATAAFGARGRLAEASRETTELRARARD
jgi:hypothetical protein